MVLQDPAMEVDSFMFLESGQYSDFTIRCKGHEWKVHRAIICGKSGFFRRLCSNGFKETAESAVNLVDDEPVVLAQMLVYLYNPKYYLKFDEWSDEAGVYFESRRRINILLGFNKHHIISDVERLSMHAKLHGMSKKYDIPKLRQRTCELFPAYMRYFIDNAVLEDVLFSKRIIDTLNILYGSTQESDRSMKETIIYAAQRLAKFLGRHDNNQSPKPLQLVARLSDEFVWDMFSMDFSRTTFSCNECLKKFTFGVSSSKRSIQCDCASRGICGKCSPVRKLKCKKCWKEGSCEVLWRKEKETVDAMEYMTEEE